MAQLLWTEFEEEGGWFFGKVDNSTLDPYIHVVLSAQPTEILVTKLKLPRQRALGLELGRILGRIYLARAGKSPKSQTYRNKINFPRLINLESVSTE